MNDKERNTPCNLQYKGVSINGSEENELPLCMENKVRVPIHLKLTLTIKEAAEYSNIGINQNRRHAEAAELPVRAFCRNTEVSKAT